MPRDLKKRSQNLRFKSRRAISHTPCFFFLYSYNSNEFSDNLYIKKAINKILIDHFLKLFLSLCSGYFSFAFKINFDKFNLDKIF